MLSKELDSGHLGKFLQRAAQVMAVLLEEEVGESESVGSDHKQASVSFSEGYVQLESQPFLKGNS